VQVVTARPSSRIKGVSDETRPTGILLQQKERCRMAEGLKIVNAVWEIANKEYPSLPSEFYGGVNLAIVVLSDPKNKILLERFIEYAGE